MDAVNPFAGVPKPAFMTPATEDYAQTPARPKFGSAVSGFPEHTRTPRLQRRGSSRGPIRRQESLKDLDSSSSSGEIFSQPWHIESNPHCNGGLKNAVASVKDRLKKKLWIGTLGTNTDMLGEALRKDIDKMMKANFDSQPVWIPDAEFESCYDEFCHQVCLHTYQYHTPSECHKVLWPCLHYAIPDAPKTKMFYESASYKQYVAVNQRFADAIIENYQEGDISTYPFPSSHTMHSDTMH